MTNAVVLLSGGLDSTTTFALAKAAGFTPYALSFRYGQRHGVELDAAARVAAALGVAEHLIVDIDLRRIGGSALTADIAVPKGRDLGTIGHGIPVTYVPARNTIFLSFALAWAETLDATTSSSGSMPWTTPVTPTAGRNTSPPLNTWPNWPPGPVSRGTSGCASMPR